jgi:hypothetical protein
MRPLPLPLSRAHPQIPSATPLGKMETILPVRANMDLHADALGLTRLRDFCWEPYVPAPPPSAPAAPPKPPRIEKREAKRRQTLAQRKAGRAAQTCERPAIEERHRQYKCFWDLTRMHSCAFSLVVSRALFVRLAYTLIQAHLVLRRRFPQAASLSPSSASDTLLAPVRIARRKRFGLSPFFQTQCLLSPQSPSRSAPTV